MILTDINRKKLENDIHYVIQWQLPLNFFQKGHISIFQVMWIDGFKCGSKTISWLDLRSIGIDQDLLSNKLILNNKK